MNKKTGFLKNKLKWELKKNIGRESWNSAEAGSPEFLSVLRYCDVARDVSENSTPVFDDGSGFVAKEVDQEGERSVHCTNVGLGRYSQHLFSYLITLVP